MRRPQPTKVSMLQIAAPRSRASRSLPKRRHALLTPQTTTRPFLPTIIKAEALKTPPSTPSIIFRKTAAVIHSGVKAPSEQKNVRFLLPIRFFVLPLGQAIRRKGAVRVAANSKREKFTSLTATGGSPHRRVATTPRREAVHQRHYTLTGVGLLCYEVRRVSHDLLLHSNASRIPFSQRTAGSSDRVPASSFSLRRRSHN